VKQQPLQFGTGRHLFGILSLPARLSGRPAILLPNTGVEHRVGPNRLHVHLSRAFTELGFPTLRMDLSGMGDSGLAPDGSTADSVQDQQAALDELQRLRIADRFIGIGLCSGGHDVHRLAKVDRRLVAAAFMDHYVWPTPRHYITRLAQRFSESRRLRNYVMRKFQELRESEKERFRGEEIIYFEQPSRRQFDADVQDFMQRQLSLFFLFTGEIQNLYNYREQLLDACPRLRGYSQLRLHYMPEADHAFTLQRMRTALMETLGGWLRSL
jgi:hypothetical protein